MSTVSLYAISHQIAQSHPELTKREVKLIVDELVNGIAAQIALGNDVTVPKLGRFSFHYNPARRFYQVNSGHVATVPQVKVSFRPSPLLKRNLRDNFIEGE